ncbi:MAG: VWA domain-containing protein [Candidatus Acidiferrales bacterium]
MPGWLGVIFFCCAGITFPPNFHARNGSPAAQIKSQVEIVAVSASVIDARGNFVADLKKENFRILDGGVDRPITSFQPVEAPAQVFVLVETSPAVYLIHTQHLVAAAYLFDGLAENDQAAIAAYSQSIRLILPMTAEKTLLAGALNHLEYSMGMGDLNLWQSISTAIDWLAPLPGKKSIVLLSTGLDSGPPVQWQNLQAKLRANETTIFTVALGGELRTAKPAKKSKELQDPGSLNFEESDRNLRTLADLTGGRTYFPENVNAFPQIYRQIAQILRHQYVLGFQPAPHDGHYHTINLQVVDSNGHVFAPSTHKAAYRVFARPGYQSP